MQRSENIELFGLVNDKGDIILEPEYDSLRFTYMNGDNYIRATKASNFGLLDLNGKEYIEMGQYEDIVSAGDIGWLAVKDGEQYDRLEKHLGWKSLGKVLCGGVMEVGDIEDKKELQDAYELGKSID